MKITSGEIIFKFLEWILFFLLCYAAFNFTKDAFEKYGSNATSIRVYQNNITERPTFVFCFSNVKESLEYGSDWKIEYINSDETFHVPDILKIGNSI